jgi:hypothetical protein
MLVPGPNHRETSLLSFAKAFKQERYRSTQLDSKSAITSNVLDNDKYSDIPDITLMEVRKTISNIKNDSVYKEQKRRNAQVIYECLGVYMSARKMLLRETKRVFDDEPKPPYDPIEAMSKVMHLLERCSNELTNVTAFVACRDRLSNGFKKEARDLNERPEIGL